MKKIEGSKNKSKSRKGIKFLKTGRAYMIDSRGTVIAHSNQLLVSKSTNNIEIAKNDLELKELAELEKNMINGKKGIGEYNYQGKKKIMSYLTVGNTG